MIKYYLQDEFIFFNVFLSFYSKYEIKVILLKKIFLPIINSIKLELNNFIFDIEVKRFNIYEYI